MQVLRDKAESCPLGNEASLKLVSLRSQVDSVGRGVPSRVKMNALRAPLTALHVSTREHSSFPLDSADAFIDMRLIDLKVKNSLSQVVRDQAATYDFFSGRIVCRVASICVR